MNYFKKSNTIVGWIAFAIAAVVYLMTMEPSASLWDCSEFIATSYKLEVGHPPGAPLFMMIARFFTMFAPNPSYAAVMVNSMSALASAFTILFLFWSITHLGRRLYGKTSDELTTTQTWTLMGAGLIGSIAFAFTDTFWFSAVEGEVYALSSLFTAAVFWAILKWEEVADEPHANRWLILIAYLMGLSIGVHILNLLAIPAIVFVYYFKKTPKVTIKGVIWALVIAAAILLFINNIIIPYTALIGAAVDRLFVNGMGLPINSGLLTFVVLLMAAIALTVYYTHKKGKVVLNTIALCVGVILIGYSSYASVVIRAASDPPMNSNNPDNPYGLYYLLNRDQYGDKPLLYGAQYSAPIEGYKFDKKWYVGEDGKYKSGEVLSGFDHPSDFSVLFPRMWSSKESHVDGYREWGRVSGRNYKLYDGERIEMPTAGENIRYLFSYQLNFMYWRYFFWNFVGRQSDNQSTGQITEGQWLSGIKAIDAINLGPQQGLPDEMANNKGRNKYYFLPLILGLIGLFYQLKRDPRNFTVVMSLFLLTGIALVFYFNTTPGEPRERDYVFAGSFYAFAIWIGMGVMCVQRWLANLTKKDTKAIAVAATVVCAVVPVILCAQNWDDHDRSHRYFAKDIGYNYLESCLPDAIIMNYGDNDTFPMWYNQEVEGVRPDVRIMNLSYLAGGWYIDQMKHAYNESAPVPFSIPQHKYMYNNDGILVEDMFGRPVSMRQAIDFFSQDDPRSMVPISGGRTIDYIPAKTLFLPVNKENVLASGIVKSEDAHLILDTITINIKSSMIDKSELMLLDLLANFDWKRPLYFTAPSSLGNLGLQDYLQFDGYAYRFVPIRTPYIDTWNVGRIDPDLLYTYLMELYRYGNIKDERTYADTFIRYNFDATRIRIAFARLAVALANRGEEDKAEEVLDYGLQEIPISQTGYSIQHLPYIEAYYAAGATEKADELLTGYALSMEQYISYFVTFPERLYADIQYDMEEKLTILSELYRIAQKNDRAELADSMKEFLMQEYDY